MYLFKINLLQSNNNIWRRILVSEDTSFRKLHEIISIIMDWDSSEIFNFYFQDLCYNIDGKIIDINPNFGLFSDMEELISVLEPISFYKDHFNHCIYSHNSLVNWKMSFHLEKVDEIKSFPEVLEYNGDNPSFEISMEETIEIAQAMQDPFSAEAMWMKSYLEKKGIERFDIDSVNEKLQKI